MIYRQTEWLNKLLINGQDAFADYGLFVLDGEYKNVIQVPPFKKLDTTEWAEYDGIEVDLSTPVLAGRTFQMEFGVTNGANINGLIYDLTSSSYITLGFNELGKRYSLRYVQNDAVSLNYKTGRIKLTFAEDSPYITRANPAAYSDVKPQGYRLDGVDFCNFGIWILEGSDESVLKLPKVRPALTQSNRTTTGDIYDARATPKLKSKDITLKCLIHTKSVTDFWTRYNSLFTFLVKPAARVLNVEKFKRTMQCYYKNSAVSKFKITSKGGVWCEFSVTLCCTGNGLK